VFLAIPLAVLGNIASRPVEKWLERWRADGGKRSRQRHLRRVERAKKVRDDPYGATADAITFLTGFLTPMLIVIAISVLVSMDVTVTLAERQAGLESTLLVWPYMGAVVACGVFAIACLLALFRLTWAMWDVGRISILESQLKELPND
jgi:hypothetical protein